MSVSRVIAALATFGLLCGPVSACPGDCDGDGRVVVAELVRGVRIALGRSALDSCAAIDSDESGDVSIAELVTAVGTARICPLDRATASRDLP